MKALRREERARKVQEREAIIKQQESEFVATSQKQTDAVPQQSFSSLSLPILEPPVQKQQVYVSHSSPTFTDFLVAGSC